MVKTFKNLFLQNQKAYDLESWYVELGARALPRSSIDLDPRSLRFNIFNVLFLETAWPIEAKFYVDPPWERKFDEIV